MRGINIAPLWGRKNKGGSMKSMIARTAAAVLIGVFCAHSAFAQPYPSRSLQMILPSPAGGVVDALLRSVSQQVGEQMGQPFLVQNRPGGHSTIGMALCAKAAPDGYTLCSTSPDTLSYNPHLFSSLPYDPDRDFTPIIQLVKIHGVIVTSAEMPFGSIRDMIDFDRAKPGALNWGTLGPGSMAQVFLSWINSKGGAGITPVPYKGVNQVIPAMLGGQVQLTYVGLGFVKALIDAGKLKPLAVTGSRRSPVLPDVPTLGEQGIDPGLLSWLGVFAPDGTPKPIIDRLNAEFARALRAPGVQTVLRLQTLEPVSDTPAEFAEFLKLDRANAGRIFKTVGIRPSDAP